MHPPNVGLGWALASGLGRVSCPLQGPGLENHLLDNVASSKDAATEGGLPDLLEV